MGTQTFPSYRAGRPGGCDCGGAKMAWTPGCEEGCAEAPVARTPLLEPHHPDLKPRPPLHASRVHPDWLHSHRAQMETCWAFLAHLCHPHTVPVWPFPRLPPQQERTLSATVGHSSCAHTVLPFERLCSCPEASHSWTVVKAPPPQGLLSDPQVPVCTKLPPTISPPARTPVCWPPSPAQGHKLLEDIVPAHSPLRLGT